MFVEEEEFVQSKQARGTALKDKEGSVFENKGEIERLKIMENNIKKRRHCK